MARKWNKRPQNSTRECAQIRRLRAHKEAHPRQRQETNDHLREVFGGGVCWSRFSDRNIPVGGAQDEAGVEEDGTV